MSSTVSGERDKYLNISFRVLLTLALVVLAILTVPSSSTMYQRLHAMELLAVACTLLISALIYWGEYDRAKNGTMKADDSSVGRGFMVLHFIALSLFNAALIVALILLYVSHTTSGEYAANGWYIGYLVALTVATTCFVWVDLTMSKVVTGPKELLEISITVFCADIPLMFGMTATTIIAVVRTLSGDGQGVPMVVGGAALFQLIVTNVIFLAIKARTYEVITEQRELSSLQTVWACIKRMRGYVPPSAKVDPAG